jgi:acyl-CoA synthetase (AMP-forming)/AMP-acid ligase II
MAQLFGQTEAPMRISMMPPADHFRPDGSVATERLTSAGRPAPLVTVAIHDEGDQPVPAGERGEICARSSLVMAGYWKNPEETARTLRHGWLHTGDIGFLDDEGFLHVVDRAKDMIITGGFNVYPSDLEAELRAHPAVLDAAVVGVPSARWGETPVAFVVHRTGVDAPDDDALREWLNARVGKTQRLAGLRRVDELPRSAIGKVLKRELRNAWTSAPDAVAKTTRSTR